MREHPTINLMDGHLAVALDVIHWAIARYWRHVAYDEVGERFEAPFFHHHDRDIARMRPNAAGQHAKG